MQQRAQATTWSTCLIIVAGACLTPLLGAAWDGLQLESDVAIDTSQPRSEVVMNLEGSAFRFDPVVVTVNDKPNRATKVVTLRFKMKNLTDDDYFIFATVTLLDADGNAIVAKSKRDKIEEDDPEDIEIRFKLPYADVERLARARATFGFEED